MTVDGRNPGSRCSVIVSKTAQYAASVLRLIRLQATGNACKNGYRTIITRQQKQLNLIFSQVTGASNIVCNFFAQLINSFRLKKFNEKLDFWDFSYFPIFL